MNRTTASRSQAVRGASGLLEVVLTAFGQFWSLLLPTECVCCQLPDTSLCPSCRHRLRRATVRPFTAEEFAGSLPEDSSGRVLPVVAAGIYRRELSLSLLAYKNRGHTDLRSTLGTALAGALHYAVDGLSDGRPVLLVPVPSTASARRRRGYEPVCSMLRSLHRRRLLPLHARLAPVLWVRPLWLRIFAGPAEAGDSPRRQLILHALRQLIGSRAGQKGLGASARRTNVRHTMGMRWFYSRCHAPAFQCLIVDDVLTTGATISEAYRVLQSNGLPVAGAVVLAATSAPKTGVSAPSGSTFEPSAKGSGNSTTI